MDEPLGNGFKKPGVVNSIPSNKLEAHTSNRNATRSIQILYNLIDTETKPRPNRHSMWTPNSGEIRTNFQLP